MHHVRIFLYGHKLRDLDGLKIADPPDIVAAEVYEHYMLCPLLWISQKITDELLVFLGACAACLSVISHFLISP